MPPMLARALALVLIVPAALMAQRPTTAADVERVLAPLADDSMAGRMTASAGEARAARVIAAGLACCTTLRP